MLGSFAGPVELSAEADPRTCDDSLLGDVSVSVDRPSLSGCHLAYLRFASCPETDVRLMCFDRLPFWLRFDGLRVDSPFVGCCEGTVLSTRDIVGGLLSTAVVVVIFNGLEYMLQC